MFDERQEPLTVNCRLGIAILQNRVIHRSLEEQNNEYGSNHPYRDL